MTRRNISLPDDLDDLARDAGLNVSALARQAILGELDRRSRMRRLDVWLDALDEEHGPPSRVAREEAEAWIASAIPVRRDEGDDHAVGDRTPSKPPARQRRSSAQPRTTGSSSKARRAAG